jgi:hypothetical protein
MIVLVCGGRDYGGDYEEVAHVFSVLTDVHTNTPIDKIVQGGAKGADRLAYMWAEANDVIYTTYKANWEKYGRSAGHRRNADMLKQEDIDLVVAFPGGAGTASMVHMALNKGIEVRRFDDLSINQNQVVL